MINLSLAEPKYLKESISIISELVNEARFKITPENIELVAMDPANVAMVIFKLLSSCFVDYTVDKETEITVNLANFKQILRRAKPNDVLTLSIDSENKLKIQMKSNTTRTFSLPILDSEEKEQKIPELKFPVTITTSCSILNDAIDDVDIVAESATFLAEQKKFTIYAEGDLSQASVDMKPGDDTKIDAKTQDKIKSKYSIEYLKKMVNGSKIADKVVIKFNKDYPLMLEYVDVDKVMMSFILAPRVENE